MVERRDEYEMLAVAGTRCSTAVLRRCRLVVTTMDTWFEKRRHHRLTAALQLYYERAGAEGNSSKMQRGFTENISMGGLYFICREPQVKQLGVNDVLTINIKIPRHNYDLSWANTLQARGQVVRIEPLSNRPDSYGIALKFLEDLRFVNS